jgi:hypothetical protein
MDPWRVGNQALVAAQGSATPAAKKGAAENVVARVKAITGHERSSND